MYRASRGRRVGPRRTTTLRCWSTFGLVLGLSAGAWLAPGLASAVPPPAEGATRAPPPGVEGAGPVEEVSEAPAVDPNSDTPPPSTYDLRKELSDGSRDEEGASLLSQLGRTLLALLIVVALIYALGRLAMARLGKGLSLRGGGTILKVLERVPLDTRHTLYVVEVQGSSTLILGGTEKGVQLVKELPATRPHLPDSANVRHTGDTQLGKPFKDVLAQGSTLSLPKDSDASVD